MPLYSQCFICREWSWTVSKSHGGTSLCLPCYVDVLEVRQARGLMGEPQAGPDATIPGKSPSPYRQLDLFGYEAKRGVLPPAD